MPPKLLDSTKLSFRQDNPKRRGTKASERFERYKAAKTVEGALQLGALRSDVTNDVKMGFCLLEDAAAAAAPAAAAVAQLLPQGAKRGAIDIELEEEVLAQAAKRRAADVEAAAAQGSGVSGSPLGHAAEAPAAPQPAAASGASALAALLGRKPVASEAVPAAVSTCVVGSGAGGALAPAIDSSSNNAVEVPAVRAVPAVAAGGATAAAAEQPAGSSASSSTGGKAVAGAGAVDLSFTKMDGKPIKFVRRVMGEARRLLSQQGLEDAKEGGYEFSLRDRDHLSRWRLKLKDLNPDGRLAKNLAQQNLEPSIDLEIVLPSEYPLAPPFARVVYPALTGGYIFAHGGICFEPLTAKGWVPSMALPALAMAIKGILDYGEVRVAGCGDRKSRTVPHYTEEGARKDHSQIVAAHRGGEGSSYGSLKHYSS